METFTENSIIDTLLETPVEFKIKSKVFKIYPCYTAETEASSICFPTTIKIASCSRPSSGVAEWV